MFRRLKTGTIQQHGCWKLLHHQWKQNWAWISPQSIRNRLFTSKFLHIVTDLRLNTPQIIPFENLCIVWPVLMIFVYNPSLHRDTLELVDRLSKPPAGSRELTFPSRFPQNSWEQFMACLWKLHLSYWRSPEYNNVRFLFMIFAAFLFGAAFWQKGQGM